jgi:hypothetical protein
MNLLRLMALLAALIALGHTAPAQTLTANTTSNNGSGGIFLALTPTTTDLSLTGFSTMFGSASGSAVNVQVWTRPGSYTGFTTSNAGWTLSETVAGTSAGTATLSSTINLATPITLPAGTTTSVYLHSTTSGGGIRYFGTGTTSNINFSNADLALLTNISRTGAVAFGGTQNTPRAFTGVLTYTPAVPEPTSLGVIGIATVGGFWLRRR